MEQQLYIKDRVAYYTDPEFTGTIETIESLFMVSVRWDHSNEPTLQYRSELELIIE